MTEANAPDADDENFNFNEMRYSKVEDLIPDTD